MPSAPFSFRSLFHADWSTSAKKRWVASAARTDGGWHVTAPHPVGDTRAFLDELFVAPRPVLAGCDFSIGVPAAYGRLAGLSDFPSALEVLGTGEWSDFFAVAEAPQQISLTRPFYHRASKAGAKLLHLLRGLGTDSVEALRHQCERATPTR
jgi:hypothetical protein